MDKEHKEQLARLKKKFGKKSLSIRVQECQLYDWDTSARMTLLVIALATRTNAEAWVQEDCPYTAEQMVGWCDQAQWRIAQRVGKSENRIQKILAKFEEDGVLIIEQWRDSNNCPHNRYQIVEPVIDDNQRPEHSRFARRPSRFKVKRGANDGSFSTDNQPGKKNRSKVAAAGADDE